METEYFLPSTDHTFFHHIDNASDIRGVCGQLGDNSVDPNGIGDRTGVVVDLPKGAKICPDCEKAIEQRDKEAQKETDAADTGPAPTTAAKTTSSRSSGSGHR